MCICIRTPDSTSDHPKVWKADLMTEIEILDRELAKRRIRPMVGWAPGVWPFPMTVREYAWAQGLARPVAAAAAVRAVESGHLFRCGDKDGEDLYFPVSTPSPALMREALGFTSPRYRKPSARAPLDPWPLPMTVAEYARLRGLSRSGAVAAIARAVESGRLFRCGTSKAGGAMYFPTPGLDGATVSRPRGVTPAKNEAGGHQVADFFRTPHTVREFANANGASFSTARNRVLDAVDLGVLFSVGLQRKGRGRPRQIYCSDKRAALRLALREFIFGGPKPPLDGDQGP